MHILIYAELIQSSDLEKITIDHQRSNFGSVNFTLAWNVSTEKSYCNLDHVLSYRPCDLNNVQVNFTTTNMEVTLPSEKLRFSGELADFNISSSNHNDCPDLPYTLRINGENSMTVTPVYIIIIIVECSHMYTLSHNVIIIYLLLFMIASLIRVNFLQ